MITDEKLTLSTIKKIRAKLNLLNDGSKIHDDNGACRFIEERGFVLLMPINNVPLPNLSEVDDAEVVPNFTFTPRAWFWKDTLPERKLCAYTKLIYGRGTFISWRLYPSFLKVYGMEGDPDYEYENGRLKQTERDFCHIIEQCSPINSRDLWIKTMGMFDGKRNRFVTTLEILQSRFFLTVAGGSSEGWNHHTWDLVEHQIPPQTLENLPNKEEARVNILLQAIQNCIAIPSKKLQPILRWSAADLQKSIDTLMKEGTIKEIMVEGEKLPWLMINDIEINKTKLTK